MADFVDQSLQLIFNVSAIAVLFPFFVCLLFLLSLALFVFPFCLASLVLLFFSKSISDAWVLV